MRDLIKNKLIEVCNDFKSIKNLRRTSSSLFDKHDLILTGPNRDRISVIELLFLLDLNVEKHIDLVPDICDEVGLKYFGKVSSQELFKPEFEDVLFTIELI